MLPLPKMLLFPDVATRAPRRRYLARLYVGRRLQERYRLQNLTLDSSIKGGLNGLDIFVEPSSAPPPPAEIGLSDTFIRKNKSGKSAKSGKRGKSKESGKSKRTDNRHTNEGGNPRLELEKDQDVLVAFDVGDLDFATVTGAQLILTIDPSYGSTGWGSKGGKAEIKYLEAAFVEGNGVNTGPVDDRVRGTGAGATHECSADTDIANNARDCAKEDRWKGAKDRGKRSDRVDFTDGMLGTLSFDVTADLRNGRTKWVIDVKGSKKNGSIVFFSKEGAVVVGDFSFAPRLVITTGG